MNAFPTQFSDQRQPLLASDLSPIGQQALKSLADKGYVIQTGMTRDDLQAIQLMADQPAIQAYCLRDCTERFVDEASTTAWLAKGRCAFILVHAETGQIAGYGWSGHEPSSNVPGGETTYALRIGQDHQGQGLALPYSQVIIEATKALFGAQHFWLEAWASNGAGVHTYHKLGFQDVMQTDSPRPLTGGDSTPDARIWMTLPGDRLADVA
jgi:ribosomal protein S18 acetylase RimI-like enzyme